MTRMVVVIAHFTLNIITHDLTMLSEFSDCNMESFHIFFCTLHSITCVGGYLLMILLLCANATCKKLHHQYKDTIAMKTTSCDRNQCCSIF